MPNIRGLGQEQIINSFSFTKKELSLTVFLKIHWGNVMLSWLFATHLTEAGNLASYSHVEGSNLCSLNRHCERANAHEAMTSEGPCGNL